jgi:hypothetical protein
MAEKKQQAKKISLSNTKKEMLQAYNDLLKQLEEKSASELKPEKKIEEKKKKEIIEKAGAISSDGVGKSINDLKLEIGTMLSQLSDRLEEEVQKYRDIQQAIEMKDREIKEIYDIDRSAQTLAALIEAEQQKRRELESEMIARKSQLEAEIKESRIEWEKEAKARKLQISEQVENEEKNRQQKKEEYEYAFNREKQIARDQFEDEKLKQQKDLLKMKEEVEKDLAEREKSLLEGEKELAELKHRVASFPKEIETEVARTLKETTAKMQAEAKSREELLIKEFEGERNVLNTKIEWLVKRVKEQADQISTLSAQLEKGYQKVQDIAEKAIEGSSNYKSLEDFRRLIKEKSEKPVQSEK